jgi:type I restriction enzyme R subunit
MGMSEADTRSKLIDPKLHAGDWDESLIQREFPYKKGRVRLVGDHTTRDAPLFVDYVLRDKPRGEMLAVVEAKDEDHGPSDGLGQALGYSIDLGVMFAYSSNGHGIVEHDRLTNKVTPIVAFPTPQELRDRLTASDQSRGPRVINRRGVEVDNPIIQPAWAPLGIGAMRWYQESSVHASLLEMLAGKHRGLLSLATGTGKTFIAFNLCWKLIESGYAKKVLFLADRVNLRDQAYNEFGAFGKARAIAGSGKAPLDYDLHFGIYQGLYVPHPAGGRLYERYPADYFDLVIIDECHRSGYGDWRAILEHFGSAFHLGMTATPKRTDSIDTYEFFASENRDGDGQPQPVFQYSLGRGIDDGYLATYRVRQIVTNLDKDGLNIEDEIERGADLLVPEDAVVRELYISPQFEKEIVVKDRTKMLCEHLAGLLRTWGANEKTMVFCVTMEHAAQVRDLLQNLLGPETGKDLYAVRIVSEEHDSTALLEQFQLSTSKEPVVATTVDLLTTGVNVPSVRNIVFMKPVGSPTVFKQIIGRGSRIDETTGKEFFRIVDYTGATRLFDDWDIPPAGEGGEIPDHGIGVLAGRVVVHGTADGIEGASLSVLAGMKALAEATTGQTGTFVIGDLPEATLTVYVAARGFTQRRFRVPVSADGEELLIELREPSAGAEKIEISGVTVSIATETELTLSSGEELSVSEYIDHAGEQIRTATGDVGTLTELWRDPEKRVLLREQLRSGDVDPAILGVLLARPDADEYDLLAHAGYAEPIRTREERARALEHTEDTFLSAFSSDQRQVVAALLDKYRVAGVDEIATGEVFTAPPFADEFGGIRNLIQLFGGPAALADTLRSVQKHLYGDSQAA